MKTQQATAAKMTKIRYEGRGVVWGYKGLELTTLTDGDWIAVDPFTGNIVANGRYRAGIVAAVDALIVSSTRSRVARRAMKAAR